RGFIDVPIVVVVNTLDESTVTDPDPEFSIDSGPATTNLSLDDKQAPLLLSSSLNGNTTTYTYRYWTIGSVPDTTTGLTLHFLSGGFAFSDGQTSTSTDPTAPVNFTVGGVPTPNIGYLDVRLTPTSGDTLDTGSLSGNELTFAGNGKGTAAPTTTVAPTQLTGTAVYRFYVTGSFAIGPLGVTFVNGSITSAGGAYSNVGETEHLIVQQLTGDLLDPAPGAAYGTDDLNNRAFVDVTYTVPTYAT